MAMRPSTLVSLAASVVALMRPVHAADPGAICAAGKLRAAAKKLNDKARCHASAIQGGRPVDGGCLLKAESRFGAKLAKLESRGGCATTGDAASIEAAVDDARSILLDLLPPTTTTTTSSTTSTSSSTSTSLPPRVCGNGVREVGEHCDGGNECNPDCALPGLAYGCCVHPDGHVPACLDAGGFSLDYNMHQYCLAQGATTNIAGGICTGSGCEIQSIDPVPLCCQHPGNTCVSAVATSTAGLWHWYNGCEGASFFSSHSVIAATCVNGTCTPS
jgi:hypothetical protein